MRRLRDTGRSNVGEPGLARVMAEWIGTWDDWSIEMLRANEVGELVFVTAFQSGRGRRSGVPMEGEVTFVFTVRQGAITRWQMFRSEEEALKSVGLKLRGHWSQWPLRLLDARPAR